MTKILSTGYAENSKLMGSWQHKNLRYTNRHARRRYNQRRKQGNLPSQIYARARENELREGNTKGLASMKAWLAGRE